MHPPTYPNSHHHHHHHHQPPYLSISPSTHPSTAGSNNNNYANVMLIVEIAERWQVSARARPFNNDKFNTNILVCACLLVCLFVWLVGWLVGWFYLIY
jgi:hypothetical protein